MEEKTTILFVETGVNGGGSFESLYQIVRKIDRSRFIPIVLFLNYTGYYNKMTQINVETLLIKDLIYSQILHKNVIGILVRIGWFFGRYIPWFFLCYEFIIHSRLIFAMRRIVLTKSVDVVILNNDILRHFFCIIALKKMNVAILSYLRSHITKGMNYFVAEYGNKRVDRYIAYSEGIKDLWVSFGVDPEKIEIIYNGIEIEDIEPIDIWKHMNVSRKEGPLVGGVGAIRPNRSFDFLIKSFSKVLMQEPGAFLVIVGSCYNTRLVNELKALIRSLGIDESVRLHGPDKEAVKMIGQMDVFCLPYKVEPLGRVLFESWAVKTPVVATKVGKIDMTIENNKNGLLVDYGDEDALCDAIIQVWRNNKLAESLVDGGFRTVNEKFSIEVCTHKLEMLCEKVSKI